MDEGKSDLTLTWPIVEKRKNRKDHEELLKLRELKNQLKIEKDVRETELIKNSVYLQDLIKERT